MALFTIVWEVTQELSGKIEAESREEALYKFYRMGEGALNGDNPITHFTTRDDLVLRVEKIPEGENA